MVYRSHAQTRRMPPFASRKRKISPEQPESLDDGGRWPEVKIQRFVRLGTDSSDDWSTYLNYFGRENYGNGEARAIGSAACTFVGGRVLSGMLRDKYPRDHRDRKQVIKLHRKFANGYNDFVGNQTPSFRYGEQQVCVDVPFSSIDEMDLLDQEEPFDKSSKKWKLANFAVRSEFGAFDTVKLGLDLSLNQELYEERIRTLGYIHMERLDVSTLRSIDWQPHVSIFRAFSPIGMFVINHPHEKDAVMPDEITLMPPKAYPYTNVFNAT